MTNERATDGVVAEEILFLLVTHGKKAIPSLLMPGKQGKGILCPLLLRMYIFTVLKRDHLRL